MPLSREDAIELTQFVENLLHQYDPGSYELVMRSTERVDDARQNLLILLETLARYYKEHSGGEQARWAYNGAVFQVKEETPGQNVARVRRALVYP